MKNRAKFVIEKSDKDGQWYWNLKARNNKVILSSEQYVSKWGAIKGPLAVRVNTIFAGDTATGVSPKKFRQFIGTNKECYFHLRARNGEIIGKSEGYKTKAGLANGIASVLENAPTAWMQFK